MKTDSEEAKNLDQFLSDMSEIFEVSKRTLKKMVFQDEEELEIIQKGTLPYRAEQRKHCPSRGA